MSEPSENDKRTESHVDKILIAAAISIAKQKKIVVGRIIWPGAVICKNFIKG
jgi:hypothetical protein